MHTDNMSVDDGFDALGYNYELSPPAQGGAETRGMRALWCAVVYQAFADLEHIKYGDEARRWLLYNKTDFPMVCMLAGMSPRILRRAALKKVRMLSAND